MSGTKRKTEEELGNKERRLVNKCIRDAFFAKICSMEESEMQATVASLQGSIS